MIGCVVLKRLVFCGLIIVALFGCLTLGATGDVPVAGNLVEQCKTDAEKVKGQEFLGKLADIASTLGLEVELTNQDGKSTWVVRPLNAAHQKDSKPKRITKDLSLAVAYIAVLVCMLTFVDVPTGFWDLLKESFLVLVTTLIAGGMLSYVVSPVAAIVVDLFYSVIDGDSCDNSKIKVALGAFLKDWPQNRQTAPQSLQGIFDSLYEKYTKQGEKMNLTAQEVQEVVVSIFSTMLLDKRLKNVGSVECQSV